MSTENLCEGSQSKISVQALNKRSLGKIAALFTKSLYKISRRGLLARSLIPIRALLGKIPVKGLLARSLNKISIRGLLARSLYKLPIHVLLARFLCELSRLARACAIDMHMDMSCHKSHFTREFTGKTLRPEVILCEPAQSKCTWQCMAMHMMSQEPFHAEKLQVKCRMPRRRHRFARACAVEMHTGQESCYAEKFKENAGRSGRDTRFVRAFAFDMHMGQKMSKAFKSNFMRKNFKGKC